MKMRNGVVVWTMLLGLAQSGLLAGTVAGWLFEGTSGQPAGEVTNAAVAGTLTGVATNVLEGAFPVYTNTVPGTNIWDGLSGPLYHADNSSSLLFTGNGLTGGVIRVADDPARTRPASVTFEAFVRARTLIQGGTIARKVRAGTGASWWLYTTSAGKLGLRIDTAAGGEGAVSLTSTSSILGDGQWHHVAFTYASWSTNAVLYVDYVPTSKKLTTPPLDYDGGDLLIGHDGAGGSFDGWIDEVRFSDKALGISQFLYVIEDRFVSDGVLLHYTFDSEAVGSNVSAVTNSALASYLSATATKTGTGSTQPQYAADRPDSGGSYTVVDGKGGEPLHHNRSSVRLWGPATSVGGRVDAAWPKTVVSPTNLTVEAFVKPDWPANYAGIFRKSRTSVSSPTFALSIGITNVSGAPLMGRCDTDLPDSSAGSNLTLSSPASINVRDGRWHHVAITYAHPIKTLRMYVDYVEVASRTTTNPLVYEGGDFVIGTSGTSYYDGWIDEVRVTGRVLSTNEFLRTTRLGTLIRME